MSRIYFHSLTDGDSEVSGAERHWMGGLVSDIGWAMLQFEGKDDPILQLIDPSCYIRSNIYDTYDSARFKEMVGIWFSVGMSDSFFNVDGHKISMWDIALNTVLAIGGDPLKLVARLHGQCEMHCYVEGPNRNWLAKIIERGLESGVFRNSLKGQSLGWESVIKHLKKRNNEPIVCSYSVCDQFPSRHIAGWEDDCDGDAWYELSESKQWKLAMAKLRKVPLLELKPSNFDKYVFEYDGLTAMSLRTMMQNKTPNSID